MPFDPRIQSFLEQAGLLVKPGSTPRKPEVLLTEQRASAAKAIVAPGSELEPVVHVENLVIPGPAELHIQQFQNYRYKSIYSRNVGFT